MSNREWEVAKNDNPLKGATVQDFLYFEGMFNPVLRFSFTNVLDEDFRSAWNSKPYVVKAHQSVKLPHYLAQKFTKEIVDKMMQNDKKGLAMAVPAERKPYEDKVLALLPSEETTELEVIRDEFIEQVKRDSSRREGVADEQSPAVAPTMDFEDLRPRVGSVGKVEETEPKLKVVKRPGRPRKS